MSEREGAPQDSQQVDDDFEPLDPDDAAVLDLDEVGTDPRLKARETCPTCGRQSLAGPIVCKGFMNPQNKGRLYKVVSRAEAANLSR